MKASTAVATVVSGLLLGLMCGQAAAHSHGPSPGFHHGVASGEPLTDAVVIWTRFTPEPHHVDEEVHVSYFIAPSPGGDVDMSALGTFWANLYSHPDMKSGVVATSAEHDWTVKVDVTGLHAGTSYIYAFAVGDVVSQLGFTKTAPSGPVEQFRYTVFGNSDYSAGYFHPYDVASIVENVDLNIQPSEYLKRGGADNERRVWYRPGRRENDPDHDEHPAYTIEDFRALFAQYHEDEGLLNMRRAAPLLALFNSYLGYRTWWNLDGRLEDYKEQTWLPIAQNQSLVWCEWMPTRACPDVEALLDGSSMPRVFEWGDLATLILVSSGFDVGTVQPVDNTSCSGEQCMFYGETHWGEYPINYSNVTAWHEEPLLSEIHAARQAYIEDLHNDLQVLGHARREAIQDALSASKAMGKPWQLYISGSHFHAMRGLNMDAVPPLLGGSRAFTDFVLGADHLPFNGISQRTIGQLMRALHFSAVFNIPRQEFADYSWGLMERAAMMEIFKEHANNVVTLSAYRGEAYGFVLYEGDGLTQDNPVAMEICGGRVTNAGDAEINTISALFASLAQFGLDPFVAIHAAAGLGNPGQLYENGKDPGFVISTVTATTHTADWVHINDDYSLASPTDAYIGQTYSEARTRPVNETHNATYLTAPWYCGTSLTATAGSPGAVTEGACVATFMSSRSPLWTMAPTWPTAPPTTVSSTTAGSTTAGSTTSTTEDDMENMSTSVSTTEDIMETTDGVSTATRQTVTVSVFCAMAALSLAAALSQ